MGLEGVSKAARRREVLLPCGWRRFLPLVALLLGRRSQGICSLRRPLPKPKIDSHAALPIYEMASITNLSPALPACSLGTCAVAG